MTALPRHPTVRGPEYADIFDERGGAYDSAMRDYPKAREAEFAALFKAAPVRFRQSVADAPAGGGYLKRHLPKTAIYKPFEITAGFGDARIPVVAWEDDWPAKPVDHVVCLAALHHFDDHDAAVARLLKAARPEGTVHIADVADGSGVARFLDEFVGAHNETGHDGNYFSPDREDFPFADRLIRHEVVSCPWRFKTTFDLADFALKLFGLKYCSHRDVIGALRHYVGVRNVKAGVELDWKLLYADLRA